MHPKKLAPAPRGRAVFPRPIINVKSLFYAGLIQKDQMLNHIRTLKFPSSQLFQFASPPKDNFYSNLSIVYNRSRNGLVPKDLIYNHIQPRIWH